MRPELLIHEEAERDLHSIAVYYAERSTGAALRFGEAADAAFARLLDFPLIGAVRESKHPSLAGLRAWRIPRFRKYLIFYCPTPTGIEIVRVLHGSRDLENLLEPAIDADVLDSSE